MDINQVLKQLDELFANHQVEQVENFLIQKIDSASAQGDIGAVITLLNEIIGHYRESGEFEKAVSCCQQVLLLTKDAGLTGTVAYATTLLNVANACRAAGLLKEAMVYFQEVKTIYEEKLDSGNLSFAGLYNNMSLLFQDMGDYESACDCQERALGITLLYSDARVESAVTYTNLAISLLKLGRYEEAIENLNKALSIFEVDEDRDYHYSGALSAMGEVQYLAGNMEESAWYYKCALKEIERNAGRNRAYEIVLQNFNAVTAQMENLPAPSGFFESGLELCKAFYEEYGVPMIQTLFPAYEGVIAAGLVGEGSECFGFDDKVSRDHDFGPGFCLWLTDSVYDEIGEALQAAYDELPSTYHGVTRFSTSKAQKRVGVFRIREFYENLIGLQDIPVTRNQWLFLDDYRLATAVNGQVFRDDLGEFTRIRRGLQAYYPEEIRLQKIARQAALMAQSGQYNYARMFGRGDKVTAAIALSEFMKHTMAMVYLLNRTYAPFYKWLHKGMSGLPILPKVADILNALVDYPSGDERIPQTIEMIVAMIIAEMKKQSLTSGEDNYLEHHADLILDKIPQKEQETDYHSALVNELVSLEWEAFDRVDNEGGRAQCQNDFNTFSIMRKSQYETWTAEMMRSYIEDFRRANQEGWNLITEKYARMMESTAPARFTQIKDSLPFLPEAKQEIIDEIVKIQVDWMEDLASRYPKAAGNARVIHTSDDTPLETSYETYLRGEISTYSDHTLDLYGRFIAGLFRNHQNLAEMTMENTASLYGYTSLEDLENKL